MCSRLLPRGNPALEPPAPHAHAREPWTDAAARMLFWLMLWKQGVEAFRFGAQPGCAKGRAGLHLDKRGSPSFRLCSLYCSVSYRIKFSKLFFAVSCSVFHGLRCDAYKALVGMAHAGGVREKRTGSGTPVRLKNERRVLADRALPGTQIARMKLKKEDRQVVDKGLRCRAQQYVRNTQTQPAEHRSCRSAGHCVN